MSTFTFILSQMLSSLLSPPGIAILFCIGYFAYKGYKEEGEIFTKKVFYCLIALVVIMAISGFLNAWILTSVYG